MDKTEKIALFLDRLSQPHVTQNYHTGKFRISPLKITGAFYPFIIKPVQFIIDQETAPRKIRIRKLKKESYYSYNSIRTHRLPVRPLPCKGAERTHFHADYRPLPTTNLMELESYPHNSGICHNERSPQFRQK